MNNSFTLSIDKGFYNEEKFYRTFNKRKPKVLVFNRKRIKTLILDVSIVITILVLGIMLLVNAFTCLSYSLALKFKEKQIKNLEILRDEKLNENNTLLENTSKMLDSDYVKQIAIFDLGMIYPTEDSIIYYEKSNSEYVRQYDNIN